VNALSRLLSRDSAFADRACPARQKFDDHSRPIALGSPLIDHDLIETRARGEKEGSARCTSASSVSRISADRSRAARVLVVSRDGGLYLERHTRETLRCIMLRENSDRAVAAILRYAVSVCRLPLHAWLHGECAFIKKARKRETKRFAGSLERNYTLPLRFLRATAPKFTLGTVNFSLCVCVCAHFFFSFNRRSRLTRDVINSNLFLLAFLSSVYRRRFWYDAWTVTGNYLHLQNNV